MYPEGWGRFSALIVFVGFNLTFSPQFVLGYMGMPRRYHTYPADLVSWQGLHVLSTAGASILGVGLLVPLGYLVGAMRYGPIATANPWELPRLEWPAALPPPNGNFLITPGGRPTGHEVRP